MRKIISINIFIIVMIAISLFFVFHACKSIIPDEFDEKSFKLSEFDEDACTVLSPVLFDTTESGVRVPVTDFIQLDLTSFKNVIDSSTLYQNSHNQIIMNNFNQLLTILEPIEIEQLMVMQRDLSVLPESDVADSCYAKLNVSSANTGELVFYTSWNFGELDSLTGFNQDNYHDYIHFDVIKSDTSYADVQSGRPLESISGCVQKFYLSTGDSLVTPVIKGREVYTLDAGDYIVRSIISSIDIEAFKLYIKSAE